MSQPDRKIFGPMSWHPARSVLLDSVNPQKNCIIILLGHEDVPRELENNAYAFFLLGGGGGVGGGKGVNEMYYGI